MKLAPGPKVSSSAETLLDDQPLRSGCRWQRHSAIVVRRVAVAVSLLCLGIPLGLHFALGQLLVRGCGAIMGFALVTSAGDVASTDAIMHGRAQPIAGSDLGSAELMSFTLVLIVAMLVIEHVSRFIAAFDSARAPLGFLLIEPVTSAELLAFIERFNEVNGTQMSVDEVIASLTRLELAGWARAQWSITQHNRVNRLIWTWTITDVGRCEAGAQRGAR